MDDHHQTLVHSLDGTTYYVHSRLDEGTIIEPEEQTKHAFRLHSKTLGNQNQPCIRATLWISSTLQSKLPPTVEDLFASSAKHWPKLWESGAAVEFAGSTSLDAAELERRVVLSQYISMSQESGSNPPQETGLMTNSWYLTLTNPNSNSKAHEPN